MVVRQADRITSLIASYTSELQELEAYPEEELIAIIMDVGFSCTCCGRCCTREFNDHVFLLDDDAERVLAIDEGALVPAPDFEFCDQNGRFYAPGYALRTRDDGGCVFLQHNRCTIYERRMKICRIYPYMLHREADEEGNVDWRQISGLNLHGEYEREIDVSEARTIADDVIEYEKAFLGQEIAFLERLRSYFSENNLRHVQKIYDRQNLRFGRGEEVEVQVYYKGGFHPMTVRCTEYGTVPAGRGKKR
ncbi:YkgJ family cysteine cluster protein [Methanofollis fontis]|uniref:Fe-S oxidoreductase n=1 Tax=Methanofollis fontis TaxID=2052832 RepID=A0A483CPL7_9EURY|nr:YkgJ family cysteine cluster protein [Methanofollis fontis]TAJ44048.1 Fe-S oxidoreductase [Methanofollis fontis]